MATARAEMGLGAASDGVQQAEEAAVANGPDDAAAERDDPLPAATAASPADAVATERLRALFNGCLDLQQPWMWDGLRALGKEGALPMRFDEIATNVVAGQSMRHGLGAFASRPIPAGTIATLYPVHSLGVGSRRVFAADASDTAYWQREPCTTAYRAQFLHAALPTDAAAGPVQQWAPGAYIDANPERPHLAGWLGHLANDATACTDSTEAAVLAYYNACACSCNAVMLPLGKAAPLMALVTTEDVDEGDELLLSYGHSYWIENTSGGAGKAPPRAMSPAVRQAARATWGDGLEAAVARLVGAYANEVKLLEGLLARQGQAQG